jgi:RNA polymerase sigma factor (sigma-70 family)
MGPVAKIVRRTLLRVGGESLTDRQLLERFVAGQDQAAFEEVVRRHGPMVLAVCRRALHHVQDAEDAFQATFIVLARKAALAATKQSVGGWLHCVASRTAWHAKKMRACRIYARETALAALTDEHRAAAASEVSADDLRPVLDEELARLPERYRAPMVLFYFEGKTAAETAVQLGQKPSTVKNQLLRARARLRGRLARRGLALSSTSFGAWLAQSTSSAALPPSLLSRTFQAAQLAALGQQAAGANAAAVAALVAGVLDEMAWARRKIVAVALLALLVGISIGTVATAAYLQHGNTSEKIVARSAGRADGAERDAVPHRRLLLNAGPLRFLAFHPTAPLLAVANVDSSVTLWDTNTGTEQATLRGHSQLLTGLAFSPDGKRLATASFDGTVRLWNLASKEVCGILPGQNVRWLQFSPNGALVALHSSGESIIRVWNTTTEKEMRRFELVSPGAVGEVLSYWPAQETLVTWDRQGPVQLWRVNLWRSPSGLLTVDRQVQVPANSHWATVSVDARQIVTYQERSAAIHDVATGQLRATLPQDERVVRGAYAVDGKVLAVRSERNVKLYDADSLDLRATLAEEGGVVENDSDGPLEPIFAPDGVTVALRRGPTVSLWHVPRSQRPR